MSPALHPLDNPVAIWQYGHIIMDTKTRARYTGRARVIKSLSHPTRLFIVDTLAAGEKCVRDLTELVGCDMSTMSKHLAVLKTAGVVQDEKRGACIYYTLRCPCILDFFRCADKVLASS
jgi:ArsR family transcriptional regulator